MKNIRYIYLSKGALREMQFSGSVRAAEGLQETVNAFPGIG